MTTKPEGKELVITRLLDAPRELVFQAWSEVEHLKRWWGPKELEIGQAELDFRPGGFFHYSMVAPDGQRMWGKFVYLKIEPNEKIVWLNSFADEAGNVIRSPFSPLIPLEIRNEVTFTEAGGRTILTLSSAPFNATGEEERFFAGMFESMQQGFGGTFDRLEDFLSRTNNERQ